MDRLSPAKATTVKVDLDLGNVKTNPTGDFNLSELAAKMDTPQTNQLIVRSYQHLTTARRSTLIFCVDINHVNSLTAAFRQGGVDARSVSSLSQPAYRRETLAAFLNQEFPVLVNCEVLTEGADIPVVRVCVMIYQYHAHLTRLIVSYSLVQLKAAIFWRKWLVRLRNQLTFQIGRGLRLSPHTGKTDCHIVDISDNLSKGIMVSPTLLGLTHDGLEEEKPEPREGTEDRGKLDHFEVVASADEQ